MQKFNSFRSDKGNGKVWSFGYVNDDYCLECLDMISYPDDVGIIILLTYSCFASVLGFDTSILLNWELI